MIQPATSSWAHKFPWKRYWCPLGQDYELDQAGYFIDREGSYARFFQKHVVAFEEILHLPCLVLLGEPGMGKSTVIAEKALLATTSDEVLFVDLKDSN